MDFLRVKNQSHETISDDDDGSIAWNPGLNTSSTWLFSC